MSKKKKLRANSKEVKWAMEWVRRYISYGSLKWPPKEDANAHWQKVYRYINNCFGGRYESYDALAMLYPTEAEAGRALKAERAWRHDQFKLLGAAIKGNGGGPGGHSEGKDK
jgi:hypothetical protein